MNSIDKQIQVGKPLSDTVIIDCHCHIGFWKGFHIPENNSSGMLKSMNSLGINKAFLAAHAAIGPDYKLGNDIVKEALTKYPDRFFGYVTVNPHYIEDINNELERCFSIKGFVGIKLHPGFHGISVDYKKYQPAYEYADKKHIPMLIHTWGREDLSVLERVARHYSGTYFIMAHAGGDIRSMELALDIVNRNMNIYIDTAVSCAWEGNIEWFIDEIGSEKILYGSDMPYFDPRISFGKIVWARIPDTDKYNILGLNCMKIFSGETWRA